MIKKKKILSTAKTLFARQASRLLYLLPPAALTGPGEGGSFGCIKTSGDNGHPRGSALKADPRSVSISPLSESSEAGALGGGWEGGDCRGGQVVGKGWGEVEMFHPSHGPHCTNLQEYSKWSLYC
ncbi:hypothetical protein ElyMa_002648300 [Elysia marginata]|uniref:Uncharacterized protein n=1 Tax=Elysia marginata TaxID=1093978 RepID=A0AAV4H5Y6_9GAST|nr:hypothetical protein ElyMa_002648300 [Elysia marginata]